MIQNDELPLIALRAPDHEALNAGLREILMTMSDTVPNRVSNQASKQPYFDNKWLSRTELYKNKDPSLQKFVRFAEQTANRKIHEPDSALVLSIMSMWCIVSRPGLVGKRHNHVGRVSGAYYVDAGSSGAQKGGLLQFFLNRQSSEPTHRIEPESGVIYLFPSTLEHSVSRYDSTDPRIVIALNLS